MIKSVATSETSDWIRGALSSLSHIGLISALGVLDAHDCLQPYHPGRPGSAARCAQHPTSDDHRSMREQADVATLERGCSSDERKCKAWVGVLVELTSEPVVRQQEPTSQSPRLNVDECSRLTPDDSEHAGRNDRQDEDPLWRS